jgi:hypothetical protein
VPALQGKCAFVNCTEVLQVPRRGGVVRLAVARTWILMSVSSGGDVGVILI